MKKTKTKSKKLSRDDLKIAGKLAQALSDNLIAAHGVGLARFVSKLVVAKIEASYKALKRQYPNEY